MGMLWTKKLGNTAPSYPCQLPFHHCPHKHLLSFSPSLVRMKDTSRKNNMFAQFRKNERDKQKLIDTVAKQLRGLISSHHS